MGPGSVTAGDVFHWHPAARLFLAGGEIACGASGDALATALAPGRAGQAFRIGGGGALAAGAGEFETLTSGSSGAPRRIRRSMASWCASFAVNARLFGIGPGSRLAVLGALEQSLALYGAIEGLHLGACVHRLEGLRPDRQRQALAAAGIGMLYASPAQLRLLADAPGPALPSLRLVLAGGAKLDPALRGALGTLAPGAMLREFYGAAEASFITLAGPDTPPESVGPAYPGVRIEVRDDMGAPLPEGARGEVWVSSPYLFTAYAGDEPGSARWRDGWLTVGETGWLAQGALFLAGRAGRMVTVADQNVFPEEIEAYLLTLPGVTRAAVLPEPDPRRGVRLVAVLAGDRTAEDAILRALRVRLGPLKAPRRLVWQGEWPLLPSGKTDLAALARGLGR